MVDDEKWEFLLVFDQESGEVVKEFIPFYVKTALKAMYQVDALEHLTLSCKNLLQQVTDHEGKKMNSPESVQNIPEFVRLHNINITEIQEDLASFTTFNDFFSRKLKPACRPIASPDDESVIVSAADCRLSVFNSIADAGHFWVKGNQFTLATLLDPCPEELVAKMQGGAVAICRLAPQDYHRWHMPVRGNIVKTYHCGDTLYTVNPMAVRNPRFNVFTENKRAIAHLETSHFGTVFLVAVGATAVGSIQLTLEDGASFERGDEHGYFQFGGSTCLLLFEPGRVEFDQASVERSARHLETLVKMGTPIGKGHQQVPEPDSQLKTYFQSKAPE